MENTINNITTFTQLMYHLDSGEVALFEFKDDIYYLQMDEPHLKVIKQPKFGGAYVYYVEEKELERFLTENKITCFTVKGATLEQRPLGFLDRIINKLIKTIRKRQR